jgi:FkbM family methyltransferase
MNNIKWKSEEGNDRWAAEVFGFAHDKFFVDAGATGGINNSAWVLETDFNWQGISVNANKDHYDLIVKQQRMNVDGSALWSHDQGVDFFFNNKADITTSSAKAFNNTTIDLSYASAVVQADVVTKFRIMLETEATVIKVPSITLEQLLQKYNAPSTIDYLALDIEGSEHEVLRVFPFDRYNVQIMSVENSNKFQPFLEARGFTRVVNPYCPKIHEHHYVNNSIISEYPFDIWTP